MLLAIVIVIPIGGIVFSSWFIPQLFKPEEQRLTFTEYIGKWWSGEMNYDQRKNRPMAPRKMFPTGTREVINAKGKTVIDSVYHIIPNLKFETQSRDSFELDSLRGKIYVADFFFATCPGICPKMSNSLERVQKGFIKDDNFRIVSFTVDPDKDTVDALRRYANEHDAIPGKWYFLRSSKENIFRLAKDGFFVTAKDDEDGGPEAFVHSEKLILIDPDGNIRSYYSGVDSTSVNKLMGDIVLLLREVEKKFSFDKQKETSKGLFEK